MASNKQLSLSGCQLPTEGAVKLQVCACSWQRLSQWFDLGPLSNHSVSSSPVVSPSLEPHPLSSFFSQECLSLWDVPPTQIHTTPSPLRRKFHPHCTVCVFRRPFQTSPLNWVKIYPTVLAEGSFYSLKVGLCFLAGWKVLVGRGPLQLCSAASPVQAGEWGHHPSLPEKGEKGKQGQSSCCY